MSNSKSISDQPASSSVSNENVVRIISLLRSGDEKLNFHASKEAILILGNTGSGKSTFTQFIAGNNDELIAVEVGENTGEFIIRDTNNRISVSNTVISKTLIPERIINRENKLVVFDCPGFGDSGRNEAYDIAAAYFIKNVVKKVDKVKIVLTVSYPSLRKGVNRSDFVQLLDHATVLIKDIEKYVDSVALIATKVDNTFNVRNKIPVLVSDSTVIQNMAAFLLEVKESIKTMKNLPQVYQSESKRVKDEFFFKNSDKLLTALLETNGTEYSRLGIFRRPDTPGRLSQSDLLQGEKKVILNMLNSNLKYVPVNITDFGYSVSDKTRNIIGDLANEIDKTIVSDMAGLNDVLVSYFEKLENEMLTNDMYLLIELLKNASNALAQISSTPESAKADELASLTGKNLPESCKPAAEPFLEDMMNLSNFYNFLQDLTGKQFESMAIKWIKQLQGSINYVKNSIQWYDFLAALHLRLSQYDVQKNPKVFHIPEFESESTLLGSNQNFTKFFNKISNSNLLKVVNPQELFKVNIDGNKIRYFNQVLSSTFAVPNFVTDHVTRFAKYDNKTSSLGFSVTGEYVVLSELLNHQEYKSCESMRIFAKHTVFIDADLTKTIEVSIIAPRWVIIGSRTIDLSGSPGMPHFNSKALDGIAGSGDRNGGDGKPGNPGESAGHFFGIGDVFENIEYLTIKAVGGTGGDGQDGGDGVRGINGISQYIGIYDYQLFCHRDEECSTSIYYSKSGLFNLNVKGDITYIKYGSPGGRGGNAGHGGAPGIGGHAGRITLLSTGNLKPAVTTIVSSGNDGEFGLHGKCGYGGSGGFHKKAWYYFGTWSNTENHVESYGKADDGEMGTCLYSSSLTNSNYDGIKQPVFKEFLFPPSVVIADFRKKLVNNLDNPVKKQHALKFYQVLQKKEIIQYDEAEEIFQELATLEKFHNNLTPEVSRILYTSLLERVRENYKNIQNVSIAKGNKLLEFLSLAINSQLVRLESKSESPQIFNVQAYFDLLKTTDVPKIHQFFTTRAKDEIKSAKQMIDIINNDILDTIERTTNEIINLSQQDMHNEFGDMLLKFKLFDSLRIISDFLMFCWSATEADLALINTLQVTSTLPKLQLDISAVGGTSIAQSLRIIEEMFEKYIDAVRSSILKEKMVLKSLDIEYDEICDQLQDVDVILQSRKALTIKSYAYPAYFSTSDVVQRVRNINKMLSNDPSTVAQDAASKFEQDFKLIEFSTELYDRIWTRGVDSSKIISYLENAQKNTSLGDGIEDRAARMDKVVSEIFEAMSPALRAVRSRLMGDLYKPNNLDELKLMISETLSRVKLTFFQLNHGFDVDEDLLLAIENINEAFDVISSFFNGVLLSHHERALFSAFYSHLKKGSELDNSAQNYLLELINANYLLYEYERLSDVSKKYISPFDISSVYDPLVPDIEETQSQNRSSIENNVRILEYKLNSFNKDRPNYILSDDFNSFNKNGPFYMWKSQVYEESISKLLRGKQIALKTTDVNRNFELLKFDDIRLSFKSNDPSTQQSLEEDLSNFDIIMTHSGRSYFNLCNRVRLMNQDAVRFVYKANETVTEIDGPNASAMKPFFSPFTTWFFELKPINENVTFSSLLPYRKTEIDIVLEGHATYIDLQNDTLCQNILRNYHHIDAASSDNTKVAELTRKRRDVHFSESTSGTSFKKLFKPFFNHFIGSDPDPRFDHSSNPELEGPSYEPNQPTSYMPSLNMTAALTLVDFVVRNITKVKPFRSKETSISPEEARIIALNILDRFENMLLNLAQDESTLLADWERNNPIELICQLEKYVLRQEYNNIINVLGQSVTLNPSLKEDVRRELVQVVEQSFDGSVLQSGIEIDNRYDGLLCNQTDDSSHVLNENFNYSLLN